MRNKCVTNHVWRQATINLFVKFFKVHLIHRFLLYFFEVSLENYFHIFFDDAAIHS